MSSEIKESLNGFEDWANQFNTQYVKSPAAKVHIYNGSCEIILLENAFSRGKDCPRYSINFDYRGINGDNLPFHNQFLRDFNHSLEAIVKYLENIEFGVNKWGSFESAEYVGQEGAKFDIYKSLIKGVRVYSPFHLDRVKRLKQAPKKWTVSHVCKALINGQYKDLRCESVYTDDYAFDAAYNFQKGSLDGLAFAKRVLESPSGWWASNYSGNISICCHHFDNNSFEFDINGKRQ